MWVVAILNKPRVSLRGFCRRFLLEVSSNVFVGKVSVALFEDLIDKISASGVTATVVYQFKKSDIGLKVITFGEPEREVVDLDGFQAIFRKNKRIS